MYENTEDNKYESEINTLKHKVLVLSQQLDRQQYEYQQLYNQIPNGTDKYDPFENPTDYKGFYGDYSKIQPRINEPNYELPLEPEYEERKNLRRFYSVGSACILLQFLLTNLFATLLIQLIIHIITLNNPEASPIAINTYMRGTSIFSGINMLVYMVCNLFTAFFGLKRTKIRPNNLIRTRNFSFGKAVQYCLIGIFIWMVSIYISMGVADIFSKYGFTSISSNTNGLAETVLGSVVMGLYTCVIAPITEEILYRGMLLRAFSKANQRFAVFATAIFFGLGHGNITQFMLAFLMGIFLAHITLKHGSVIPSIIVHMFMNTFSTVISLISTQNTEMEFFSNMVIIFGGILGAIMLTTFRTQDKIPSTTPKQSRRGFAIASGSWIFSLTFGAELFYIFYILYIKKLLIILI